MYNKCVEQNILNTVEATVAYIPVLRATIRCPKSPKSAIDLKKGANNRYVVLQCVAPFSMIGRVYQFSKIIQISPHYKFLAAGTN
jgi:hypothetical protein